jgi:putative SOS response-associated peptidase YedK
VFGAVVTRAPYSLATVPIIRLNDQGEREMVAAEWGLLPFRWKSSTG